MRYAGLLVTVATVASGCQAVPRAPDYTAAAPSYEVQPAPASVVSQQPVVAPQQPIYSTVATSNPQLEASLLNLKERLERVEKAMLRLDRRMQLVERNELSRMSTAQAVETTPTASEEQMAMQALNIGPSQGEFRAVSSRGDEITSALQAAPRAASAGSFASMGESSTPPTRMAGLPSLADPLPAKGNATTAPIAQVAIWTVKYDLEKVWPGREQLPGSKDVVDSLRQSGGMTLYARGKNANGVQFRERVKALSRYLSKVSGLDSVPIIAMAAPHLDDQTIEILATH